MINYIEMSMRAEQKAESCLSVQFTLVQSMPGCQTEVLGPQLPWQKLKYGHSFVVFPIEIDAYFTTDTTPNNRVRQSCFSYCRSHKCNNFCFSFLFGN